MAKCSRQKKNRPDKRHINLKEYHIFRAGRPVDPENRRQDWPISPTDVLITHWLSYNTGVSSDFISPTWPCLITLPITSPVKPTRFYTIDFIAHILSEIILYVSVLWCVSTLVNMLPENKVLFSLISMC